MAAAERDQPPGASDRQGHSDDGPSARFELDDVDVRDLLRKALEPPTESKRPEILPGVQQRIRERSKGKFYADGWSTSSNPRATFLVTSLIMLVVIVVTWLMLSPQGLQILP